MKYLIISFKSRNDINSFATMLKRQNIFYTIINTPKSIGSSCTLSIKADFKNFQQIVSLLNKSNLNSFLGLYSYSQTNIGTQTLKLM